MPHDTPLIATIAIGLALAFVLGLLAQRMRLPPIVGYLLAGIVVGPFTPGYVADQELATELAEIGVILLMFGVGLHFSLKDLLSVRAIAIPGAIGQIAVATLLGTGLGWAMGWPWGAGVVFGLCLSVASTVVLLRALQERRLVETERGRIAVGWLIVEDLVMVLTLVLLPPLAGFLGGTAPATTGNLGLVLALGIGPIWTTLLLTGVKVGIFVALMLIVGRRIIPWVLHYVAHTGSRELFRLAVLAIALGVAYGSASLFGVSFALGAFFAGMVLAESQLSTQAAKETLPLRDAFAVLFFVSVGMLLDPAVLLSAPLAVLATFFIIVLGKSAAAYLIVRAFGHSRDVALTISASLAQIGEFSFILVVLGGSLQIVPDAARDLVVAGAILSILLNPLLFLALGRVTAAEAPAAVPDQPPPQRGRDEKPTVLSDHVILVGHGRVGSRVGAELSARRMPFLVVEADEDLVTGLREKGIEIYAGPCGEPALLERLNLGEAKWLITAIPDAFEAGHIIEAARIANPAIGIIARAHSNEAVQYLRSLGAGHVLMGEDEIADGMLQRLTAQTGGASPSA
ncbi:YbaL family putative K(+) efflux transporter [Hyphomonas sp.]|uniref:YbaL family putative K(+) efflux transporter n=1 Tax=Hyphomonas sp. TaxID=87 RepID=UPI0025C18C5B|nr:YbaL family putative K(+) efflux transporter [Hyphomonas sp.]